jgi:hypothetical protein
MSIIHALYTAVFQTVSRRGEGGFTRIITLFILLEKLSLVNREMPHTLELQVIFSSSPCKQ